MIFKIKNCLLSSATALGFVAHVMFPDSTYAMGESDDLKGAEVSRTQATQNQNQGSFASFAGQQTRQFSTLIRYRQRGLESLELEVMCLRSAQQTLELAAKHEEIESLKI